jgi:hypothetical protein
MASSQVIEYCSYILHHLNSSSLSWLVSSLVCIYCPLSFARFTNHMVADGVGIIAVPVCPPDPSKLQKDLVMFNRVVVSSDAKVALTSSSYDYMTKISAIKVKSDCNICTMHHSALFLLKDAFSSMFTGNGNVKPWPEVKWIVTDSTSVE